MVTQPISHEKSCGVIPIWFDGKRWRFLLVQQKSINWGIPRGHVEAGETEEQTALRELREETGVRVSRLFNDCRYTTRYSFSWGEKRIAMNLVVFLGLVEEPRFRAQREEILDIHWFDFPSAKKILGTLSTGTLLQRAQQDMVKLGLWQRQIPEPRPKRNPTTTEWRFSPSGGPAKSKR